VRLPGARRLRNRQQAQREGVRIPAELMANIRRLAGEATLSGSPGSLPLAR